MYESCKKRGHHKINCIHSCRDCGARKVICNKQICTAIALNCAYCGVKVTYFMFAYNADSINLVIKIVFHALVGHALFLILILWTKGRVFMLQFLHKMP